VSFCFDQVFVSDADSQSFFIFVLGFLQLFGANFWVFLGFKDRKKRVSLLLRFNSLLLFEAIMARN
jgi:hypothetical protein